MHDSFRVLTVCTANQCRSPLAEHLLRAEFDERGLGWKVASAGTSAEPGIPVYPPVLDYLAGRGIDASGHRSRPITEELVASADLILTAGTEHRSIVASRFPEAVGRVYTLKQFARLAHWVDQNAAVWLRTGEELLEHVAHARTRVPHVPRGADDIADPVGRSRRAMRRCEDEIEQVVHMLLSPVETTFTRIMNADDGASY